MTSIIVPLITCAAYITLGIIFSSIVKIKNKELDIKKKQLDVQAFLMNNPGWVFNTRCHRLSGEIEYDSYIYVDMVPKGEKEFTVSRYKFYCPRTTKYPTWHWEDLYMAIFGESVNL